MNEVHAGRVGDEDVVVWCTASGTECVVPRWCPHLDWDLVEAVVVGDELVCPGHGWSIATDGRVFKRNEAGREDDKGRVPTWSPDVVDG